MNMNPSQVKTLLQCNTSRTNFVEDNLRMSTKSETKRPPYYHEDVDFAALALQDEEFAALLRSNNGRIDWQDPLAVQ